MIKYLHKFANPAKFLKLALPVRKISGILSIMAISLGLAFALFFSPPDYQQKETVRIMYIGLVFTFSALFSGSLWGKPTWGTYWVWDARLTSFLILFFIFLGLKLLRDSFPFTSKGDTIFSYLAVIGGLNLPIIKFSVDWWNTLHQPASILRTGGISINNEMLLPLFLMAVGFMLTFIYTLLISVEIKLKEKKV